MSLFEVKGWDVPPKAIVVPSPSRSSRKRKRSTNDPDKVQSAQVNLEKLMRRVEKDDLEPATKKRRDRKEKRRNGRLTEGDSHVNRGTKKSNKVSKMGKGRNTGPTTMSEVEIGNDAGASSRPARKKGSRDQSAKLSIQPPMQQVPRGSMSKKQDGVQSVASDGLTSLQSNMKGSLDGARFRWINEVLYTTGSGEGHKMMREDPNLYEEYHTGFRQQVRSWPSNPISHYIQELSSYPRGTVIADLGCGDASLARSLIPKGYGVLSFDLVSDGVFVLEADVCKRIPLPGSESQEEGQIVDVCVCALSLMSLDWIECIRETWRILRFGGELMIAEVTSRFMNVDQFLAIISSVGFKLKSKDESNTHFTLFKFEKSAREKKGEKHWEMLRMKHTVLKPCEYKRR